jgi:sarcosine oxidase subunit delta
MVFSHDHVLAQTPGAGVGLRIPCPRCGSRPYTEFWYGGELRPEPASPGDLEEDFRVVWLRENAAGVQSERWFHAAGCRRWLTVDRDTASNDLHGVR